MDRGVNRVVAECLRIHVIHTACDLSSVAETYPVEACTFPFVACTPREQFAVYGV